MSLLLHAGYDGLRHDERRVEVDVYHLPEVLYAHFFHRYALDDTGIVHQDVYHSQLLVYLLHKLLHLLLVGHVGYVALGVYAFGLIVGQCLLKMFLASAVECYLCAGLGKGLCNGKPNAVSGTGYEGYLALKRKILRKSVHIVILLTVISSRLWRTRPGRHSQDSHRPCPI